MDNIYRVYCINLRRRNDRLENFLTSFPKSWFSKLLIHGAVDGQNYTLTPEDRVLLRNANWNIDMGRGQWGCSFSHAAVWRDIVNKEYKYAIVLEDDAVYNGPIDAINKFIGAFIQSNLTVCLLGPSNHPENTAQSPHNFNNIISQGICHVSSNLGSMSYIISLQGARDLLSVLDEKGHYRAIDQIINDYMKQRNAWICSAPPLFKLNTELGSDIVPVFNWKPNTAPKVQIFIIFHKYINETCYKNIPDDILYKYFTFIAVNKSIAKTYPVNSKKYKIINEWDLLKHDPTFQMRGYHEQSVIYHIYANELHNMYDFIGFFQYDMMFNNNIIDFLFKNIDPAKMQYFPLALYDFDYCHYKTGCEPSTLDFVIADYEKFFNKKFNRAAAFPLWNTFVLPKYIYTKIMPWITQLYSKLWPWCVSPPNQSHYRHMGGIYERIMAYAISQEDLSFIKVDVVHDHAYKDMTQTLDISNTDTNAKICFITAIYGNYETSCKKFVRQSINTDFICFTDNINIIRNGWIIDTTPYHLTNRNSADNGLFINSINNKHTFNVAKYYKQSFKNIPILEKYDVVVWLDGTVEITYNKTSEYILRRIYKDKIIGWHHEMRHGILSTEVAASHICRYVSTHWNGQDQPYQDIDKQYKDYIESGYNDVYFKNIPDASPHLGVWITCFVAFLHKDSAVNNFLDMWYLQTLKYTTQDQIGFSYVCQKTNLVPKTLPDDEICGEKPHEETMFYKKHEHGI